jgi:hypothetical protein
MTAQDLLVEAVDFAWRQLSGKRGPWPNLRVRARDRRGKHNDEA